MGGNSVEVLTVDPVESSATRGGCAGSTAGTERVLAGVLAEILHVERVSVDGHFFDDLGADSLVMAQFCARVRKRADVPSVSMRDIYQHPTISGLATALAPAAAADAAPTPVESSVPASAGGAAPAGTLQYVLCGTLQFLIFLGYCYVAAFVTAVGFGWISGGSGLIDIYLRSALFGGALFLGVCILPILAKWMLIGRWKPRQIRVWSLGYVRFWTVKTLVRANPLVLFAGSPLYSLYLRALGAKVGRGVVIFSPHVPVCTDLLTIGAGVPGAARVGGGGRVGGLPARQVHAHAVHVQRERRPAHRAGGAVAVPVGGAVGQCAHRLVRGGFGADGSGRSHGWRRRVVEEHIVGIQVPHAGLSAHTAPGQPVSAVSMTYALSAGDDRPVNKRRRPGNAPA